MMKDNKLLNDTSDFGEKASSAEGIINHDKLDDKIVLKQKLSSQESVVNEYKHWIVMLVNIINNSENSQYVNQIKKGLDKVEYLYTENIQLKKRFYREIKK